MLEYWHASIQFLLLDLENILPYLSLFTADLAQPLSSLLSACCLNPTFGAHFLEKKMAAFVSTLLNARLVKRLLKS